MKSQLLLFLLCGSAAQANLDVGTLTEAQGDVQIFSHPGKRPEGPPPHALYKGIHYSVKPGQLGDRVGSGVILRTGIAAIAKVTWENGDQVTVGPGSSYRLDDTRRKSSAANILELFYGKLRLSVGRLIPGKKPLGVSTEDALMGVRGTDFFVSHRSGVGTDVVVFRGEVEVMAAKTTDKTAVGVGQTARVQPLKPAADVAAPDAGALASKIALRPLTRADVEAVRHATIIDTSQAQIPAADVAQHVTELNAKAAQTALNDIRESDPKLFETVDTAPPPGANVLADATLKKSREEAAEAKSTSLIEMTDKKSSVPVASEPVAPRVPAMERRFFLVGVGLGLPPKFSGSGSRGEQVERVSKDGDGGPAVAANLALYWRLGSSRTLLGPSLAALVYDSAKNGTDVTVERFFAAASMLHFLGEEAGQGAFVRADFGPSLGHVDVKQNTGTGCGTGGGSGAGSGCNSTTSNSESSIGLGAQVGLGYSFQLFRGLRVVGTASVGAHVGGDVNVFAFLPQIAFVH